MRNPPTKAATGPSIRPGTVSSDRLRTRTRLRPVLAAVAIGLPLLTATAAGASETISYKYDARGRLKQVARSGTVNNGAARTYAHDRADNRMNVGPNRAPTTAADSVTVRWNCTFSKDVLVNDSDPEDNLPLTLISVAGGNGSGQVSGNSVTYTTGFSQGTAILTYSVADSLGATSNGTLAVTTSFTATCP